MNAKHSVKPPRLAYRIFEWYCGSAMVEDITGDIDELFYLNLKTMSPWRAKLKYTMQVFALMFSYAVRKRRDGASTHPFAYSSFHPGMIRNYFKIALRVINKSKAFTLINVMGLALGICASIVIYTIAHYEFSFDTFHQDREQIYRADVRYGETGRSLCVPPPAGEAFRDVVTGAEAIAAYIRYEPSVRIPEAGKPDRQFERKRNGVILTNADYFSILPYRWLAGGASTMNDPLRAVITDISAKAYFGDISPSEIIGREIIYDDSLHTTIAGVVEDWKGNTDFRVSDFISSKSIEGSRFLKKQFDLTNWGMLVHYSQMLVKVSTSEQAENVSNQMTTLYLKHSNDPTPNAGKSRIVLEPLDKVHFNNSDEGESTLLSTLYTLIVLAAFIMLIAAINYVNLSTALSIRRSREIGIRKVLGGARKSLIAQFLVETFVIIVFAVVVAVLLVKPVMWGFDSFIDRNISFDILSSDTLIFLGILTVTTTIFAGAYPSWMISSQAPVASLKGASIGGDRWMLRKGLIVFQFALSLFFIIGTTVVSNQIDFIRTEDRGFTTDGVITIRTDWNDRTGKVDVAAGKIGQLAGVENTAVQFFPPMGFARMWNRVTYKGKENVDMEVSIKAGDARYIPVYGIQLLTGRNIQSIDSVRELVINAHLATKLGYTPEQALGEQLYFGDKGYRIVGVAKDFHEFSFREPIGPTVIVNFSDIEHGIAVRLSGGYRDKLPLLISQIEKEFKAVFPGDPFDYHFIEDEIGWMHEREHRTAQLMSVATAVTIFISCLGVFGLAMFTAHVKTKEIGIRKVLGASIVSIVNMLSKEFVVLISISFAIACPVAWYFMNDWLMAFAYHESISVWVFVVSGIMTLVIGLVTLSFQSVRAALANPVDSLRIE